MRFPRKPYRHFWRAQFEKLFLALLVASSLWWSAGNPDHPWSDEIRVFVSQAVALLLLMFRRGTWVDPKNGDGQASPKDGADG